MRKRIMRLGVSVLMVTLLGYVCVVDGSSASEDNIIYSEGFETGEAKWTFWATNCEYELNFNGATEEKAHFGKKSLKLDLTLNKKHYNYWRIPVPGKFKLTSSVSFSGYLYYLPVNVPTDIRLGYLISYPKAEMVDGKIKYRSHLFYAQPVAGKSSDSWIHFFDENVYEKAKAKAGKYNWSTDGMYIERVAVYIVSGAGWRDTKVVVYVDDVKIEKVEEEELLEMEVY